MDALLLRSDPGMPAGIGSRPSPDVAGTKPAAIEALRRRLLESLDMVDIRLLKVSCLPMIPERKAKHR